MLSMYAERCMKFQNISGLEISCPKASLSNVWDSTCSSCSTGLMEGQDSDYYELSGDSQRWAIFFRYQGSRRQIEKLTYALWVFLAPAQNKQPFDNYYFVIFFSLRNPSSTCQQLWLTNSTGPNFLVLLDFWTPLAGMFPHLHTVCTLTHHTLNT